MKFIFYELLRFSFICNMAIFLSKIFGYITVHYTNGQTTGYSGKENAKNILMDEFQTGFFFVYFSKMKNWKINSFFILCLESLL